MRKINEVARLKDLGLSNRKIAESCHIARSTVADYVSRLEAASRSGEPLSTVDAADLEAQPFPVLEEERENASRPLPDWTKIREELRRKGVTLKLLWQEYRQTHPDGYGYSQFCELYRRWAKGLDLSMRQIHRAGEKLFVDYAGMTMSIADAQAGENRKAQIFVAAMGCSQYIYAEATLSQRLPDWIGSHVRTFDYLGGVPEQLIPDNLRSAVSKACRYEPEINPTYTGMAVHYGVAVLPARGRKPKDKAKVESAVQIVEREILAPLRDRVFFSLAELNQALREGLEKLNNRPFRKLKKSRRELFESFDEPALKPLPAHRYEYGEFSRPRVNIDYHLEVRGHYYSVPYHLRGKRVDVHLTARMVEIFHRGKRIASHMRDDRKGRHTTDSSHMPEAHRKHLEWTPSRLIQWAGKIGEHCARAVERIIKERAHPEQGYRACLGIMRLSKGYSAIRVEAACRRALALDVCSYRSIQSILKSGKDAEALPDDSAAPGTCKHLHQNIRGKAYYNIEGNAFKEKETAHAQ